MKISTSYFPILAVAILAACGTARDVATDASVEEPAEPTERTAGRYLVSGYHPWWTQDAWRGYDLTVYDEIYFFSLEVDSTGGIADRNGWPDRWFSMQREFSGAGVRVTPVVTLSRGSDFERIFSVSEATSRLMGSLLSLLRDSPAVGGLQIDFEVYRPVSSTARSNFTDFVVRLRQQMESVRQDLVLSMYLLAYDESDVYDEGALSGAVDYVVVQGYDLHGRNEGQTGPVAALEGWGRRNWNVIVDRYLELGVPREKIVMSAPYFGYEWPAGSAEPGARTRGAGRTISYAAVDTAYARSSPTAAIEAAQTHGLERDAESGSPYYAFEDSTGWRQGWFEDAESLAAKYAWVAEEGLLGVAIFPLAYGTDELEAVLREYLARD